MVDEYVRVKDESYHQQDSPMTQRPQHNRISLRRSKDSQLTMSTTSDYIPFGDDVTDIERSLHHHDGDEDNSKDYKTRPASSKSSPLPPQQTADPSIAGSAHNNHGNDDVRGNNSSLTFRQQMGLFFEMASPYFRQNSEGRCLFVGLICLMLLDSVVRVVFSYLARDFWTALNDKDADEFYRTIRNFCIALLLLAPINVLYKFQQNRLAIRWRTWMTNHLLSLYFYNHHQIYYKLEQQQQQQKHQEENQQHSHHQMASSVSAIPVDNPDQRIAEDVRSFTEYSLSFFLTVTVSVIDMAAFSIVLYFIEPTLFLSIIGFAAIGTFVTVLIGRRLVKMNFERLQYEADFRLSLVRIRSNAESIAFFRGEQSEGKDVQKRFKSVIANAYDIIGTQRDLGFFTTSYNYLTWILPVVVVAPQYMAGAVELGVIQQSTAAFGHILEDLSLIINNFETLTAFTASIGRLHQFLRAIQMADPDRDEQSPLLGLGSHYKSETMNGDGLYRTSSKTLPQPVEEIMVNPLASATGNTKSCIHLLEHPSSRSTEMSRTTIPEYVLSIHDLRLDTPIQVHHRTLIPSLNLKVKWGERLLIHGESGIGKSSLLRAIAGLWTSGSGTIERANDDDVYFLPQRPYCPNGTLREQLLYPEKLGHQNDGDDDDVGTTSGDPQFPISRRTTEVSDAHLLATLDAVGLRDLPYRVGYENATTGLDASADWSNMLSLGEQQRLAFARILVHKPRLVIVDEATSACDVKTEEKLYSLLRNLRTDCGGRNGNENGISTTYVSVGHRPSLLAYHTRRLHIFKDDTGNTLYSLSDIHSTSSTDGGLASDEVAMFFR